MVIKRLTKVRSTMQEKSENFNKEIKYIRKYQTETTELTNTINAPKNSIEEFNIRLVDQINWR